MSEIIKIIGIGVIALIVIIIVKQYRPEFAVYISIIAGMIFEYLFAEDVSGFSRI